MIQSYFPEQDTEPQGGSSIVPRPHTNKRQTWGSNLQLSDSRDGRNEYLQILLLEGGSSSTFYELEQWEQHLRGDFPGTTILLTSYCLPYGPCLTLEDAECVTPASNAVLFLAHNVAVYLEFFSPLSLLQGGYLLEVTSTTSTRALCFRSIKANISSHLLQSSILLNYSFANNSFTSIDLSISHHSQKRTEVHFILPKNERRNRPLTMAHIHAVGQDLLRLCYSIFPYSVDIHQLWSGTEAINQGGLLISSRDSSNTLEFYAYFGLCAFCWREFIGF